MFPRQDRWVIASIGLACVCLSILSLSLGSGGSLVGLWNEEAGIHALIVEVRLPRVLGCLAAGALLGLGGLLAQALFRNPLADPYLLGTASGAELSVTLVYAAGLGTLSLPWLASLGTVIAAFCGAWLALALSLVLVPKASDRFAQAHAGLLLAGLVVALVLGAISNLLTHIQPELLRYRQAFTLGQTSLIGWDGVWQMLLALSVCLFLAQSRVHVLDALTLGLPTAASLGLAIDKERNRVVVLMAACTAMVVAHAGLIGFVGLLAPHAVRPFVAGMHRSLMLASALSGALLLSLADLVARTLWMPQEIPTGMLTAVLGGIFLLGLLRKKT